MHEFIFFLFHYDDGLQQWWWSWWHMAFVVLPDLTVSINTKKYNYVGGVIHDPQQLVEWWVLLEQLVEFNYLSIRICKLESK